jgi:hypothetical protein
LLIGIEVSFFGLIGVLEDDGLMNGLGDAGGGGGGGGNET